MLKRLRNIISFALLSCFPFCLSAYELPRIIDIGSFPNAEKSGSNAEVGMNIGCAAFNWAPELTPVFALLKRQYHINTVVETGTFIGASAFTFGLLFDDVHTIELSTEYFQIAGNFLKDSSNIHQYLGSSEQILRNILPSLANEPVLFYLDAHWNEFWPLLGEIEEISKTHRDNCVIVIDDFKVPGRPEIPYDAYGPHECSLRYVKPKLDKLFSAYTVHWLIPKSIYSRAKLIAIPNSLKRK